MTMLELERVDVVEGQVPLPGMDDAQLRPRPVPVRRPDGRLYRPRRLPQALVLGPDDIEVVSVVRTHNIEVAERLALQELRRLDGPDADWSVTLQRLSWGRWRPDRDIDGSVWVEDATGLTGTPAVFFEAVWR